MLLSTRIVKFALLSKCEEFALVIRDLRYSFKVKFVAAIARSTAAHHMEQARLHFNFGLVGAFSILTKKLWLRRSFWFWFFLCRFLRWSSTTLLLLVVVLFFSVLFSIITSIVSFIFVSPSTPWALSIREAMSCLFYVTILWLEHFRQLGALLRYLLTHSWLWFDKRWAVFTLIVLISPIVFPLVILSRKTRFLTSNFPVVFFWPFILLLPRLLLFDHVFHIAQLSWLIHYVYSALGRRISRKDAVVWLLLSKTRGLKLSWFPL